MEGITLASITVRIDDAVRDVLQAKAEDERQTLSDFIRDRLQDAVFEFRDGEQSREGLEPETLTALDRHMLALLHRILGRVLPEDANDVDGDLDYQLERAKVLERGFTKEYWIEFAGIRPELNARRCAFVMDVLDMFRIALYSINDLREKGTLFDDSLKHDLTFQGFDHNDEVENQMSDYVRFLVKGDKWTEQEEFVLGRERGNSHHPMADVYSRMLTAYREVKQSRPRTDPRAYLLTEKDLARIAAARIHPSNRP
jgi:uncharacterized protein YfbU (UPF0304 family)